MLVSLCLHAQQEAKPSAKEKPDTVRHRPTGIRVGIEAIGPAKSYSGSDIRTNEIAVDTDLGRYFLTAEFGTSERMTSIPDGTYENNGRYFRFGVDINFLKKDPDRNMFFLGARYGRAFYDEKLAYTTQSDFGDQVKISENTGLSSGWLELTTGLKVKVWKIFWLGYTARMKFAPSTLKDAPLAPYEIPGYGLTFKKPWWGFNYYLLVRLPLRK